ncbi:MULTISPECIES: ABC transporter permease [unclassified Amycolatopsis]|uniref:ABC transporter permease n=1 Tax=unclassified Amycolatopsis TaxID=2618356 RepID=UPI002874CAF9|nr:MULTISPECIES: ABC transporter permease [unclassified Amycolatopsis]MDS0137848.1 ABC transporter permease [Amycolatopsis sp. 505]MDS0144239.1 ABC transporter permease [Amycolatopsis sp. CM201R]
MTRPAGALALVAALAGALVAVVLGFLTFGAQATVAPDGVPVAVAAPPEIAQRIAAHGGGQLAWTVATPAEARQLLEDKKVYGVLELGPGPSATVVTSGAVNPAGTQVAQQALTGAATALAGPPKQEVLHPVGLAGRTAPLAASALAWIGALVAGLALTQLAKRTGRSVGAGARFLQVVGAGVLITAVVAGFFALWDATLPLTADVLGFVFLAATAFAALQAGLLRLLGLRAMAVLAPLYLVAPAVAGQVPELLNPAYRALLWSWTPFRFSTEGLRSLLQGVPGAPDVTTALWVLGALLAAGLLVALWPVRSAREEAEPHLADGVVEVGVH